MAVGLLSLATAAHQGWSANLFTLVSDMFPKNAVGSVVGIGGMFGAVGGMLIATAAGYLLEKTGSYVPLFLIASRALLWFILVVLGGLLIHGLLCIQPRSTYFLPFLPLNFTKV